MNQYELNNSMLQPHFDEEATLVSARPVVPLSVVRSRGRRRNLLILSSAIALSILVGAFGATLIYSQRNKSTPAAGESNERSYPAITTVVSGGTAAASPEITSSAPAAEAQPVSEQQTQAALESRTIRTNKTQLAKKSVESTTTKNSANQRATKVDRSTNAGPRSLETPTEERRPRRVDEDKKRVDTNNSSDLFRIRDIFEGPRSQRRRRDQRPTPY